MTYQAILRAIHDGCAWVLQREHARIRCKHPPSKRATTNSSPTDDRPGGGGIRSSATDGLH